jgi:glutaminyl-peptide cyclotransferase
MPLVTSKLHLLCAAFVLSLAASCSGSSQPAAAPATSSASAAAPEQQTALPSLQVKPAESAPPADRTGGFDGEKAYEQVAKIVSFGPRPPDSPAIHQVQDYLIAQLKSSGCEIDTDDFHASTPIGSVAMKNIIAKAPGTGQGIILLLTHYDTLSSVKNFVGAEDSASSTGLMLELARQLCTKKGPNAVWFAFVDGEESFVDWNKDNDHTYGSRELAARMGLSGELKRVKAVILADMIGQYKLRIPRQSNSTKWLVDLVWKTAARLGYSDIFVSSEVQTSDDHDSFLDRKVPAIDVIDLDDFITAGTWHTEKDTMDQISPRSIAIVGHVLLESVAELQTKFK